MVQNDIFATLEDPSVLNTGLIMLTIYYNFVNTVIKITAMTNDCVRMKACAHCLENTCGATATGYIKLSTWIVHTIATDIIYRVLHEGMPCG